MIEDDGRTMTPTRGSGAGVWAARRPSTRAWKGAAGRSREAVVAEQDRAAGGRHRRWVDLGEGRFARASVELKVLPSTRRIRAYLRWSDGGRSTARYLGEVEHPGRPANLAEGWRLAWERDMLSPMPLPAESWASTPSVRSVMKANKGRDTGPERRIRTLLHAAGLRYRVSARPIPTVRRTADIVFLGSRVAVFVDGCYWHGCPEHYRPSTKNGDFWRQKIDGNRQRDADTDRVLSESGWTVIRIWEHEDPAEAAAHVLEVVRELKGPPRSRANVIA
jgi:DNA mismatch endonuclease Vsr